jgi:hypothetical protein
MKMSQAIKRFAEAVAADESVSEPVRAAARDLAEAAAVEIESTPTDRSAYIMTD